MANDISGGLASHKKRKRINKNGFARAGFARQQVETRAEDSNGMIDNGVIFSAQLDEHIPDIRAQHSMAGTRLGPFKQVTRAQRDQNDNLEGQNASDTVNTEVNTDSYCCRRLRIAG